MPHASTGRPAAVPASPVSASPSGTAGHRALEPRSSPPPNSPTLTVVLSWFAPGLLQARLRGEVDASNAEALDAFSRLRPGRSERLVVDAAELTFIDAAGLRRLVAARRAWATHAGGLAIVNPSPMLRRLLAMTGLDDLVPPEPRPPFEPAG